MFVEFSAKHDNDDWDTEPKCARCGHDIADHDSDEGCSYDDGECPCDDNHAVRAAV